MELNIEAGIGITPEQTPLTLVLCTSPVADDTVSMEMRKMNPPKKGEFEQYTLYGKDSSDVLRSVRFLMGKDLLPLMTAYGKDTSKWQGQTVSIRFEQEKSKADGKMYNRVHINPMLEALA